MARAGTAGPRRRMVCRRLRVDAARRATAVDTGAPIRTREAAATPVRSRHPLHRAALPRRRVVRSAGQQRDEPNTAQLSAPGDRYSGPVHACRADISSERARRGGTAALGAQRCAVQHHVSGANQRGRLDGRGVDPFVGLTWWPVAVAGFACLAVGRRPRAAGAHGAGSATAAPHGEHVAADAATRIRPAGPEAVPLDDRRGCAARCCCSGLRCWPAHGRADGGGRARRPIRRTTSCSASVSPLPIRPPESSSPISRAGENVRHPAHRPHLAEPSRDPHDA